MSWIKVCLLIGAALPQAARSTAIEWNNTGTGWTTGANWVGGVAPSSSTTADVATFGSTGASATSPTLSANRSIAGLNFLSGAYAYTLTNSGSGILLIGSTGITDSATNLQTFNGPLAMSISQTWTIGTGGSMLFNGTVDLNNNATTSRTLTLAGSGNATFGVIQNSSSGSTGSVTVTTTGTITITGASTYNGTTTISAGTLQLGSGGTAGSIDNSTSVVNNGTLAFNRSDNALTIGVAISGSGAVNQLGTGTTILSATNSYTGQTTISAGTLQLGTGVGGSSAGNVASSSGIVNNGTLTFNRTGSPVISTVISGSGAVNVIGNGTVILSETNTYTGITTISAGTLQLGSGTGGGSTGNISNSTSVVNNSVLTFNRSNSPVFSAPISGSGAVNVIGNGTVTLSETNTYTGVTTISAGTLQLGSGAGGGTTGNISSSSSVVNNSVLTFNRSNSPVFAAPISGNGAVNVIGNGTIILTNAHSYSGPTTISAGVLQVGNNGTTGALSPNSAITNNATLAFRRSDPLTVSTTISGSGVVNQIGAGTTTLSGANSYGGGTAVNAGSLIVTNTTGSATGTGSVASASTTTLGGTGTIAPTGSNGVTISGTLSPGVAGTNNGAGTLTFAPVNGNVTLASTSNVIFQLNSNGANGLSLTYNPDGTLNTVSGTPSTTGNDRLVFNASGLGILDFTAATAGSLDVVFASGYTPQALDAFDLIDWNNVAISGLSVSQLDLPSLGNPNLFWDTSKFVSNGVIAVAQVVATPEPNRACLLAGGSAWLCLKRRRARETRA